MGLRKIKQCYVCKQQFRREELVDYAPPGVKNLQSYCPTCLKEKQNKDKFSQAVCSIFGIKSPGPRIWKERQNLIAKYGYTDDIIIDCLDYIYNVQKTKKLSETLYLVNPPMIEKMLKYKHQKEREGWSIANAIAATNNVKVHFVPIREKKDKQADWDPDDFLDYED